MLRQTMKKKRKKNQCLCGLILGKALPKKCLPYDDKIPHTYFLVKRFYVDFYIFVKITPTFLVALCRFGCHTPQRTQAMLYAENRRSVGLKRFPTACPTGYYMQIMRLEKKLTKFVEFGIFYNIVFKYLKS